MSRKIGFQVVTQSSSNRVSHGVETERALADGVRGARQVGHLQLGVHVLQVPAERLALKLLTQRHPIRDAATIWFGQFVRSSNETVARHVLDRKGFRDYIPT